MQNHAGLILNLCNDAERQARLRDSLYYKPLHEYKLSKQFSDSFHVNGLANWQVFFSYALLQQFKFVLLFILFCFVFFCQ